MTVSARSVEVELKIGLPPAAPDAIARTLAGRAGHATRPERLRSVYFDAPDGRLAAAGIAVRVRHQGRRRLLTVKADRVADAGFSRATEVEAPLGRSRPDLSRLPDRAMRERIEALLAGAELEARFETDVTRRRFAVQCGHGLVEVALDRGAVRGGGVSEPISEMELELLAGTPEALFLLAEELAGPWPVVLDLPSKAERGWRLLGRSPEPPPAEEPGTGDAPAAQVIEAQFRLLSLQIADRLRETMTSATPSGPHQLRVGLRRLRAMLWLHRPQLRRSVARELALEARAIARLVSPLRDADVLLDEVLAAQLGADAEARKALQQWRETVRANTRRALAEAGASGLAIRLAGLAALGGWQRGDSGTRAALAAPELEVAGARLERLWRKARDEGDRLAVLPPAERHELRKELKRLRYALETATGRVPGEPFQAALRKVQESLGALNDLAMLEALSSVQLPPRVRAALAGLVEGAPAAGRQRMDQLLGRACRHWQLLTEASPPWREDAPGPLQLQVAPSP